MKREDHLWQDEQKAKRSLENLQRRWPFDHNIYVNLLLVFLIVLLILALI